ncbi:MAG: hypothetical protein PHV06_09680 [bacterium]|nr:hypothetical protein [bacterium]
MDSILYINIILSGLLILLVVLRFFLIFIFHLKSRSVTCAKCLLTDNPLSNCPYYRYFIRYLFSGNSGVILKMLSEENWRYLKQRETVTVSLLTGLREINKELEKEKK